MIQTPTYVIAAINRLNLPLDEMIPVNGSSSTYTDHDQIIDNGN